MQKLFIFVLSLVTVTLSTRPCAYVIDYPEVVNLDNAFWYEQDALFINAAAYNYTTEVFSNKTLELFTKYTSSDINLDAPPLGINSTGYDEIVSVYNLVRQSNKGERHYSNGLVVDCTDSNSYVTKRADVSLANTPTGSYQYVGDKTMYISRPNILHPFKIDKIVFGIQAVLPNGPVSPWGPQN